MGLTIGLIRFLYLKNNQNLLVNDFKTGFNKNLIKQESVSIEVMKSILFAYYLTKSRSREISFNNPILTRFIFISSLTAVIHFQFLHFFLQLHIRFI